MSGPNLTGKPQPDRYKLGRGILYFAELDDNGRPKGWRDLGNAPEFNLNIEQETLEHRSSREGLRSVDKEVTISRDLNFNFQLEEFNHQNMAALFSGERATHTNVAVAGFSDHTAYTDVQLGHWYDIIDSDGNRAYDITASDLTVEVGATTLVKDTDYEVDTEMGRIFLLSDASDVSEGDDINMTLDANAYAGAVDEVQALTQTAVTGALKFIEENPADSDRKGEYTFWKINLTAEGDVSMIGDEWANMPFSGKAQKNEDASPNSPTLTIRHIRES